MRVSAVRRQERDTPTHLIKNCTATHDGRVSKGVLLWASCKIRNCGIPAGIPDVKFCVITEKI